MHTEQEEPKYLLQQNGNKTKWRVQVLRRSSDPRDGDVYTYYDTVCEGDEKKCREKYEELLDKDRGGTWKTIESSR